MTRRWEQQEALLSREREQKESDRKGSRIQERLLAPRTARPCHSVQKGVSHEVITITYRVRPGAMKPGKPVLEPCFHNYQYVTLIRDFS